MADKQKIMIVDDDENIAELISLYLIKECYETLIVTDGEAALKAFSEFSPNLILLDLIMPDMDGIETFKRLKREKAGQVPPVIILTAVNKPEAESQCLRMGAVDFIQKPFSPEILVLRVMHVLELARLQKNLTEALAHKAPEE